MSILKGLSAEDKESIAIHRDEKCFKRFFIGNFNALERYAEGIVKDRQTAEDLVSEMMWKLWHLGPALMEIGSPDSVINDMPIALMGNSNTNKNWNPDGAGSIGVGYD